MLYFMVCAEEAAGEAECRGRGWSQVAFGRFYTPDRDDVRVIRRFTDMTLLPGGTLLMAGPGFLENPDRGSFEGLVSGGHARWVKGEEPRAEEEEDPVAAQVVVEEPELVAGLVRSTRNNWPPRTAPELRTGGRSGPRPYRR